MAAKEGTLKSLMKLFRIGLNKNQDVPVKDQIRPLTTSFKPEKFNDKTERLWNYWMNQCHDDAEAYRNMNQVWQDMDMLYFNSPIFTRAMKLVTDETIQADLNNLPIGIEAKEEQKDFILNFFDKINFYSYLKPLVSDIVQYGNGGPILELDNTGVAEIMPVNVYDLKAILEFTPYEVKQRMEKKDKFFIQYCSKERIHNLIQSIMDKDSYSSYFKSYILGYQISDFVLPPWRFVHYKNRTTKSPFKPYGAPLYIHGVAPYRQYDAAMTMQVIARGLRFPTDKYSITASNVVDPVSKLNYVVDFIREFQNSGLRDLKKEDKGIGDIIVTVKDLFDYEQLTPNIDLGKIDDIQMLRDDLIQATEIPRNLIDPNDSAFGDSGVALVQKFKPFARLVYNIQSIILEGTTQLCKIHMLQSKKFSLDDINFQLTMPYPESQVDKDLIDNQKDLLDLANSVLDSLGDKLLGGQPVPDELTKAVYYQILPYDQKRIDMWFDIANNSKNQDKEVYENPDAINSNMYKLSREMESDMYKGLKKVENKIGKKKLLETISNEIFEKKQSKFREGRMNGKHYFSSKNGFEDFKAEQLREWEVKSLSNDNSVKLKEEIKYVFNKEEKE